MEEKEILKLYWKRDEQAIEETERAYGGYCRSVAGAILRNPADVEEVVADTWLKAWNAIPPANPGCLKLFLARIARNLAFSVYRSQTAEKRGGGTVAALEELGACVPSPDTPERALDERLLKADMERFLHTLPARDRMIFVRRYFFVEETRQIARRFGLRESNVLMILSRTRKKLKKYLIQEGYLL